MEVAHITAISIAVHIETPMPLIRFQDTTARYLLESMRKNVMARGSFLSVTMMHFSVREHFKGQCKINLPVRWNTDNNQDAQEETVSPYLSTLRAHKLNTVIPTEVFCMKGTSLQSTKPNGQSSAMSWGKTRGKKRGIISQAAAIQGKIEDLKWI